MEQGRSHVSKIVGVHLSFWSLQTSNYSGQRCRVERNGEGCPLPSRLGGLGERRKLLQRGLGRSPSRKRFGGVSCAILCNFTHLLVNLTAEWKWKIPTSLVASRSDIPPLTFWGCVGHPKLNFCHFWGCPHVLTPTTPIVAAPLVRKCLVQFGADFAST